MSAGVADEAAVWEALGRIADPELPVLSIVDLGVVVDVSVEDDTARIRFTPTFVGCPAVEPMKLAMREAVAELGLRAAIETTFAEPWTSDRITAAGRRALADAGIAPPGPVPVRTGLAIPLRPVATCPICGSRSTRLENAFGPTACRAIWYCDGCRQPFEGFKAV